MAAGKWQPECSHWVVAISQWWFEDGHWDVATGTRAGHAQPPPFHHIASCCGGTWNSNKMCWRPQ